MKKTGKRIISGMLLAFMFMQAFSMNTWAGTGHDYQNGSTIEYVYSTVASCNAQGNDYIGYLYTYASYPDVWMYGYYAGCYIVSYNINDVDEKYGFVKYNGGNTDPFWQPKPFTNGPSNLPVYSTWHNARDGVNSIGYIYPYTECTQVMYMEDSYGYRYALLLYSTSTTAKVGLAKLGPK